MTLKDEVEDIAKKNPQVDLEQLKEAQAVIDALRDKGLARPRYDIDPPYGNRPPRSRQDEEAEIARRKQEHSSP